MVKFYLCILVLIKMFSPQDYGVRGFPTIKVFVPGKPPIDYQGARDAKAIAQFAIKQVCSIFLITWCCSY